MRQFALQQQQQHGRAFRAHDGSALPSQSAAQQMVRLSRHTQRAGITVCRASAGAAQAAHTGPVIAVGEALYDLIADQQGVPREKVQSWTPFAGGAPANVATSLGKLGIPVLLVGALGKDEAGDKLYQLLEESGVRLEGIQRTDAPTREVFVVRNQQGDREFAGFGAPTDTYCDAFLDADALPVDTTKEASWVVTGTLGLAYPGSNAAIRKVVQLGKQAGAKVLVDINWRPVFWPQGHDDEARRQIMDYLQQADLIKISDADLEWLLGMRPEAALDNPCAVADRFPKAAGVLVTAGDGGAAYCFRSTTTKAQHSGFVPVFKLDNVIDTTGAGDAFTAGFLLKALQAGSLEALTADARRLKEAVVFASAAGALTCTRKGAIEGQPTLAEVEALFETSKVLQD